MKSNRKIIIGVMGGGAVSKDDYDLAYELGKRIAKKGWILLNGGRNAGVMRASAEGAKSAKGMTIGILPGTSTDQANPFIDIPIVTGLSDARNFVNILTSNIIVACRGSAGTISEIALALKNTKNVILLNFDVGTIFDSYKKTGQLLSARSVEECMEFLEEIIV